MSTWQEDEDRWEQHFQENAVCLVDNHAGIYIPQTFIESLVAGARKRWGITARDARILRSGPNSKRFKSDLYWDVWDSIFINARYIMDDGRKVHLYTGECGDLFAVPEMNEEEE